MDIIDKEEEDEEMEEKTTTTPSTPPTWALTQLAAKLKQVMGTNTSQVLMLIKEEIADMDTKDPKKWAWAPTPIAGTQATISKNTQIRPPELKKPRNNGTPPCTTATQDVAMTDKAPHDDQIKMQMNDKSLQEQEKPLELKSGKAEWTEDKQQQQEEHNQQTITITAQQDSMNQTITPGVMADKHSKGVIMTGDTPDQMGWAKGGSDKTSDAITEAQTQNEMDQATQGQKVQQEITEGSMEDMGQQKDNGSQQLTELSPKEW